jgi:hypothetical protein
MPPFISFRVSDSRSPFMNDIFAISGANPFMARSCLAALKALSFASTKPVAMMLLLLFRPHFY